MIPLLNNTICSASWHIVQDHSPLDPSLRWQICKVLTHHPESTLCYIIDPSNSLDSAFLQSNRLISYLRRTPVQAYSSFPQHKYRSSFGERVTSKEVFTFSPPRHCTCICVDSWTTFNSITADKYKITNAEGNPVRCIDPVTRNINEHSASTNRDSGIMNLHIKLVKCIFISKEDWGS